MTSADPKHSTGGCDVFETAAWLRQRPLVPYERLAPTNVRAHVDYQRIAKQQLVRGSATAAGVTVELTATFGWSETGLSRSQRFHMHAWEPFEYLLVLYSEARDAAVLERLVDTAWSWCRRAEHHLGSDAAGVREPEDFRWYDMGVALRAHRLAYICDAYLRDSFDPDRGTSFVNHLSEHQRYLKEERTFARHSNHGFYQAAAQICAARRFGILPGMPALQEHGLVRLKEMVSSQYSDEGVHREHSPGYHEMVTRGLDALVTSGVTDDDEILGTLKRAQRVTPWMVDPDGHLVNFGDTDVGDPFDGERDTGVMVFPKSGYAATRHRTDGLESFLAVQGAFHSRTHKHADDGTFVWHDRGVPIFVDAGRFGYLGRTERRSSLFRDGFWYSDPRRVFVESSEAHNVATVDGRNYERRGVRPFGSSIVDWFSGESGLYAFELRFRRYRTIVHHRLLVGYHRHWLLVFDWFADGERKVRRYEQWFHVHPRFVAVRQAEAFHLRHPCGVEVFGAPVLDGQVERRAIYGEERPALQGWWCPSQKMEPCWALSCARTSASPLSLATLWSFGSVPVEVLEGTRSNASARRFRVLWTQGADSWQLQVDRRDGLSVTAERGGVSVS